MAWKPIVAGVDDTPQSVAAAALAWKLAEAAGTSCRLVHAIPDVRSALAAAEMPTDVEELSRGLIELVDRQLRTVLRANVPPAATNSLTIRVGRPAVVLKTEVDNLDAGLVVLGGKHHSALGRWLGGSTSLDVVRTLRVPALVTKGAPTVIRRVLVAVDLSYAAQPAIEEAEAFARLLHASLRALHVVEPLPILPEMPLPIDPQLFNAQSESLLERDVWPLLKTAAVEKAVRYGSAAETISADAAEWKADLLVLGSHGRGWVDRLLLGSVTERLLNHLPTSLLVVPAPAPEAVETVPARGQETKQGIPKLAPA